MTIEPDVPDNAALASQYMYEGGRLEKSKDWRAAAEAYRRALSANSPDPRVHYFANNNLGYVLLQMEKCEEAAELCRNAIAINPEQYNAHKNLGLAFQGQGLWTDAAWCYLEATQLCPGDARAWQLLEHLLQARPRLLDQDAELGRAFAMVHAALEERGYLREPLRQSPMFKLPPILPDQ